MEATGLPIPRGPCTKSIVKAIPLTNKDYKLDQLNSKLDEYYFPAEYANGNPPGQLLAPISASTLQCYFKNEKYWYIVECVSQEGRHWQLARLYEDFHCFQTALLQQFPNEFDESIGTRTLPFMPDPALAETDGETISRCKALNEYVMSILALPDHISKCQLVRQFFAPREADFELSPGAIRRVWPHSSMSNPPLRSRSEQSSSEKTVTSNERVTEGIRGSQTSRLTPTKSVVNALPTVRDHTTDQLSPELDEYIPRQYDEAGEKKVSPNGQALEGREYKCRTFLVPNRGDKLFMLATECARVLGYRDSYLLFNKNRSLLQIIATQAEKDDLIHQEILPYSYRSQQITIVTAKSMFRQFGSRVIADGRCVQDDYWEAKARKQGFIEEDLVGEKRSGDATAAKEKDTAKAANAAATLSYHPDIIYSNVPGHILIDAHGDHPQYLPSGPMITPLPMIVPLNNKLRLREFSNIPRYSQPMIGSAYHDRTQTSQTSELQHQASNMAEFSKVMGNPFVRPKNGLDDAWKRMDSSQRVIQSHIVPKAVDDTRLSLHRFAMQANEDIAEVHPSQEATINATNSEPEIALLSSVKAEVDLLELLDQGVDIEAKDESSKTALHVAAEYGNLRLILLLLEHGANIEAEERTSCTALHLAAMAGQNKALDTLIAQGANIEAKNEASSTPLHLAARYGQFTTLETLINQGADVDVKDKDSRTASHLAAMYGHYHALELLLVQGGANTETKDGDSRKVLHYAAIDGKCSLVELLLDQEANIEARDKNSSTALHLAATYQHLDVLKMLLDRGADIEARDKNSSTALHLAVTYQHLDVLKILLDRGADIKAYDENLCTALDLAVVQHDKAVINQLINRRADTEVKNRNGDGAFDVAASSKLHKQSLPNRGGLALQSNRWEAIYEQVILGIGPDSIRGHARFQVYWDLPKYYEEEVEGKPELASLLTISGTAESAYATTCGLYLGWCWPKSGQKTMELLQTAIGQERYKSSWFPGASFEYDSSTWNTKSNDSYITIEVSGTQDHILDVAQQLSWITATFRAPRYGELATSDVRLEWIGNDIFKIYLKDLRRIENSVQSSCWHSLFKNAVIAYRFPIPARQEERGVELPFEVMTTLSNVSYLTEIYDGVILKGPFTALIPTAKFSNSIQWHFMSREINLGRLQTGEIAEHVSDFFETYEIDLLRTARTFLGYCRNAEIHLGTENANYNDIERSDAHCEHSTFRIGREVSLALGTGGMGTFGGMLGLKVTYSKGLQATTRSLDLSLRSKLLRSRNESLLLYDTEKSRGWLVSELSVILHLAHFRALNEPDCHAQPFNKMPFAKLSGDGGLAAWSAVMERIEPSKDPIEGNPGLDVIKDLMTVLENRKELAVERKGSFSNRFRKSSLRGWEFVDVAALKFLCSRKEVSFNRNTGGNWYQIAEDNPELVVLFGKGFGEPIRPQNNQRICRSLTPMPVGKYYLVASIPCLQQLINNHTKASDFPKLTPNMYWHRPLEGKLFETCTCATGSCCNGLQDLRKKSTHFFSTDPQEWNGAIVFGVMTPDLRSFSETKLTDRKPDDPQVGPSTSSGAIGPQPAKRRKTESRHYWQEVNLARRRTISNSLEETDSSSNEDAFEHQCQCDL